MADGKIAPTVNVALLGYGYAGKTFHAPLITSASGMQLAMVVSSDEQKVLTDLPDVKVCAKPINAFEDDAIDLVVIATPNDTHCDLAKSALMAGKHVVVDKPFTTNAEEARQLIHLASQHKKLLSVFHNRRWDADFLTLQRVLEEGILGEIMHFESHFDRYRPEVRQRWRESAAPGGGLWYDLGPHLVDQALKLFGMPDFVYGDCAIQRKNATAVDYFDVQLSYGAKRVILHGGSLVLAETPRFIVHGTMGSFIKYGLDTQEDALKRGEKPGHDGWGIDSKHGTTTIMQGVATPRIVPTTPGDYSAYYQGIQKAIEHGAPNPVRAEDALAVMEILDLAANSAATGQKLRYASKV